ncbi:lysozyme [Limimaricola variabilis]|uniref:lysozyme n=1 Tax=Limimaricola variabilis TaxID=1492771 RepID=UPI002AC8C401|nr:lysozyme [Limimaricola variabilis]WPY93146.1 lysozyme [Limimaricola variabilis]
MKISDRGLLEIAEHEGIVPAPYYDSVGVLTYGIGHTKNAGGIDPADLPRGMPADLDAAIDHAIEVFRADIASYEARVNEAIKVPLAQHQLDALGSFDLNTGGIYRAILTRQINAGDPKASEHFFGWLRPPEIRKRRTAEKRLFDTGDYDWNGDDIAIWRVDARGKLRGVLKTISGAELLERMQRPAVAPIEAGQEAATSDDLIARIHALTGAHLARTAA